MNATLQTLLGMKPFMEQLASSYWKDGRNSQCALLQSFCVSEIGVLLVTAFCSHVLIDPTGRHVYKQHAAGCHKVSYTSSALISRSLQFIQLGPWP
jgi:hypothetical protein